MPGRKPSKNDQIDTKLWPDSKIGAVIAFAGSALNKKAKTFRFKDQRYVFIIRRIFRMTREENTAEKVDLRATF